MEPFDGKGTHQVNAGPNENLRIMIGQGGRCQCGVFIDWGTEAKPERRRCRWKKMPWFI